MRRIALAVLALAALALGLAAALALAGPGDLDRGFGPGGTRTIESMGYAGAMAVQPDGKIVVAGFGTTGDVAVGRINPDGSDDPAFGGTRLIDFGSFDLGEAVALQPDGKIVVAGRSGANAVIARLNPDGSPDMGFGTIGKRVIDYGGPTFDRAEGVAIQPDGKIVLAGVGGLDPTIVVTRLEPDGADDTGFGLGGTQRVNFGLGYEEGRALALQPDGKIVVAGYTGATVTRSAVARLNLDGSPDMGFGTAGKRVMASDRIEALAIQPNGGIVIVGEFGGGFLVTRLHEDGFDDLEFGGEDGDAVRFDLYSARADAVALQPDGKIVAVGTAGNALAIARLQPGGALDATFGGFDQDGNRTGRRRLTLPVIAGGTAVALQDDGRIVAAGATNRGHRGALRGRSAPRRRLGRPGRSRARGPPPAAACRAAPAGRRRSSAPRGATSCAGPGAPTWSWPSAATTWSAPAPVTTSSAGAPAATGCSGRPAPIGSWARAGATA